jgi:hypothetical protein
MRSAGRVGEGVLRRSADQNDSRYGISFEELVLEPRLEPFVRVECGDHFSFGSQCPAEI